MQLFDKTKADWNPCHSSSFISGNELRFWVGEINTHDFQAVGIFSTATTSPSETSRYAYLFDEAVVNLKKTEDSWHPYL